MLKQIKDITLVGKADNKRLKKVTQLALTNYPEEEVGTSKYMVYFDPFSPLYTDTEKTDTLGEIIRIEESTDTHSILDVTNEDFPGDTESSYYVLAIMCADFVTCSSTEAQAGIYMATGRLAHIFPLTDVQDASKAPTYDTDIADLQTAWYGEASDIMSIKPFISSGEVKVYTPTILSNTNTKVYKSTARLHKRIKSDMDIVFLPKTFSAGGEERRISKVIECTNLGKLVVAPEIERVTEAVLESRTVARNLIKHDKANGVVREAQAKLKTILENEYIELQKVIDATPDEEYQKSFDDRMDDIANDLIG